MENLQIRGRWLERFYTMPGFQAFDCARKNIHLVRRDNRQLDMVIDHFVMIEGDLGTLASGVLLGGRLFRFAVTVRRAAAFGASEHKILFAGDAPTPHKGREKEQGKKRVGESSTHPFKVYQSLATGLRSRTTFTLEIHEDHEVWLGVDLRPADRGADDHGAHPGSKPSQTNGFDTGDTNAGRLPAIRNGRPWGGGLARIRDPHRH